jgi:hypothetical protein
MSVLRERVVDGARTVSLLLVVVCTLTGTVTGAAGGPSGPAQPGSPASDAATDGTVEAAATVSSCGTLSSPGVYTLGADIEAFGPGTCLVVASDGVRIDGAGHEISTRTADTVLVGTDGGDYSNVTVEDLSIDGGRGVVLRSVDAARVTDLDGYANTDGLNVSGSDIEVSGVDLASSSGTAVGVANAVGVELRNVSVGAADAGVSIGGTNDVVVENLSVTGGQRAAIEASGGFSSGTNFTFRNVTVENANTSVALLFVSDVTIRGLEATRSTTGVRAELSGAVRVVDSRVDVGGEGLAVLASSLVARNATVTTDGFGDTYGVRLLSAGDSLLRDVTVTGPRGVRLNSTGNVTVEDLTARVADDALYSTRASDLTVDGVDATVHPSRGLTGTQVQFFNSTDRPVVRNVTVDANGTTVYGLGFTDENAAHVEDFESVGGEAGVSMLRSANVSIVDASVADAEIGVEASGSENVYVRRLETRNVTTGVSAISGTRDLRLLDSTLGVTDEGVSRYPDEFVARNVTITGPASFGIELARATNATLADVTVRDATGTAFDLDVRGRTDYADLAVRNVTGDYVVAPNDTTATVTNLSTDRGRYDVTLANATVGPPDAAVVGTSPPDTTGTDTYLGIGTVVGGYPTATIDARYDESAIGPVDETNLTVSRDLAGSWQPVSGATVDEAGNTVTWSVTGYGIGGTYGLFTPQTCPIVDGTQTRSVDADADCEDVDGDGRFEFLDVVALLFADFGAINADPAGDALDIDGSGKVDFLDVVALLFELS